MRKIILSLIISSVFMNSFANEYYDDLNNKSFEIGWYFWLSDSGKAYLASEKYGENGGVSVWNFTDERKWKPIHNASIFDGYPTAGSIFSNVNISSDGKSISFGDAVNNNSNNSSSYTTTNANTNYYNSYYSDIFELDGYYTIQSAEFKYFNGDKESYSYSQIKGSYLTIKNDYYYMKQCYNGVCDSIWEGDIVDMDYSSLDIEWIDYPQETLEYKISGNKLTIIDKNFDDGVMYEYWVKTSNSRSLKTINREKKKFFKH